MKISTTLALAALLTLGPALSAAEEPLPDTGITTAIEEELFYDPAININNVDVITTEGIVTLTGTVPDLLAYDRAERLAETVRGVRSVVNLIEVEPGRELSDQQIEADIESALVMDRATESYEVGVSVTNGIATLFGVVDSYPERSLAERVARSVHGVRGVENTIDIVPPETRPDAQIEEEIAARLRWDALINAALVEVDVDNGSVELHGTVGSAAEKRRATTYSWVAGVRSVDASNLQVEWWARDPRQRHDEPLEISDEAIEQAINDAFLYDPRVQSFDLNVNAQNGVVALGGTVDNLQAKRAAERDARSTWGVVDVQNRIEVRPNTPSDMEIAQNIREALARDAQVNVNTISVRVLDNTAILSGEVDSYLDRARADDIASRIYGVIEVRNDIDVRLGDPLVANPFVEEYEPLRFEEDVAAEPVEPEVAIVGDEAIEENIRTQIEWNPFVSLDQISVEVEDSRATLTGEVESLAALEFATEEAYEGGALEVDNQLTIAAG